MRDGWVCFLVNQNFLRRGIAAVREDTERVFGDDFLGFELVDTDQEEVYAFAKCADYLSHLSSIRGSPAIKGVLPSFDSPFYLSDKEVRDFVNSSKPAPPSHLKRGDIVAVKAGYLKNLTGIVVKGLSRGEYMVVFRLFMKRFWEELPASHLERTGNLFDMLPSDFRGQRVSFDELCPDRKRRRAAG
jgi:transcription antitermination factor NusG